MLTSLVKGYKFIEITSESAKKTVSLLPKIGKRPSIKDSDRSFLGVPPDFVSIPGDRAPRALDYG